MTSHTGHAVRTRGTGSCACRIRPPRHRAAGAACTTGHAGHVPAQPGPGSQREYARWRARQIAYGRWQPWMDAGPVRDHVRLLRQSGASYHAIAAAAGVSVMMVYRLQCGEPARGRPAPPRVHAHHAHRLLAVTPEAVRNRVARRDACGARWRLRALTAMGYPATSLARHLDVPPRVAWDLIRGCTATISHDLHIAVCGVYERMWDLRPPERTCAERRAAAAARGRAARNGWPPPMGLDDELIDDPAYKPRAQWRPAAGTGVAPVSAPRSRHGAQRGHATRQPAGHPARGAEEVS